MAPTSARVMSLRRAASHVAVAFSYALLCLFATYPLLWNLDTQVAGKGEDMWICTWDTGWAGSSATSAP